MQAQRMPSARKQLTPAQMSTIHDAVAQAGLAGLKINLMHMSPMEDPAAGQGSCHAQQLPNGHWVIVCD